MAPYADQGPCRDLGSRASRRCRRLRPLAVQPRYLRGATLLDCRFQQRSGQRIYGEKIRHWVVVSGFDQHFVYVNDPYVDREEGKTRTDSINIAISQQEFTRMSRYGRAGLQAVVLVFRNPSSVR